MDDATHDGDKIYRIQLKAALSSDLLYKDVAGGEVIVINKDNDP